MKRYPQALTAPLTARLLAPPRIGGGVGPRDAASPGHPLWRAGGGPGPGQPGARPGAGPALSSADKCGVVLATARLNEHERGEDGRAQGRFVPPVQAWRARGTAANATGPAREIRQRRHALQRQDPAWAAAAARRLLPKKVQARGGEAAAPAATARRANP